MIDGARYAFHYSDDPRQIDVFRKWEIKYDGVPSNQTRSLATVDALNPPLPGDALSPPLPGDTLRIEVSGFTIKGFHNGVEVISATDTDMANRIALGEPGMAYRWATSSIVGVYPAPVWERWSAGSLLVPPPASADITVLDTSGSATDLQVSFSNVIETASADFSVTIRNDGSVDLALQQIAVGDPLAPPFSIQTNNCMPGMLTPNTSCSFVVRFSPLSAGTFNDTFDIPSNDPDENPVTVSVSGTGISAGTAARTDNSGSSGGSMTWLLVLFATVTGYLRSFCRGARSSLS